MGKSTLKIATCQFAVGKSIKRNATQICKFLTQAKKAKADIVHFSECALSGYVGTDFPSFDNFNWQLLRQQTQEIIAQAKKYKLWVILGSTHRVTSPDKPYNSLYLISPEGKIANRYDKRFCIGQELKRYTPGNRFVTFNINGVKCALMICFELRFPELYRQLYKRKVNCVFQSFYNARQEGPSIHTHIMRQTMQCRAATNYFWVSMTNSSGYYSPYPSCFIQPDGKIVAQLNFNRAGIMINKVDLTKKFYDPMANFRDLAIKGILTNAPKTINKTKSRSAE